ncbi:hypothetical protein GCM10008012_16240 [Rhizobium anhuiense]|nr:hypothetical protein GCM10008012_16240 [Rhizobium anhuiense]
MIARKQDPAQRRIPGHLAKRLPKHGGCRRLGIECIARQQDNARPMLSRRIGKPGDHAMPGLTQAPSQILRKIAKSLANMKVRTVQKGKH